MTKQEFLEKWGYLTAKGYGPALFDCKAELEKDLLLAFGIQDTSAQDNQCQHPRSDSAYVGNNTLRCGICGEEFD